MSVRTGLVGAGPWATMLHAPMLAQGPGTSLEVVWARRHDAASELAAAHGARAARTFDELLDSCDAVAFAVPPDVQSSLAPQAARAGKHLLLDKPLGFGVAEAERLVEAVDDGGVQTLLLLTNRFTPGGREFLDRIAKTTPLGAQAAFVSGGSLPGSPFATPWRVERGALLDVGPHALDLLDAALGRVVEVSAAGDATRWLALTTQHESGLLGQAVLSITSPGPGLGLWCRVHTPDGPIVLDGTAPDDPSAVMRTIAQEFAATVQTGQPHHLDVHRGLVLQQLIAQAEASLKKTA